MEKQFEDVEEYWTKYKALPLESFEEDAIKEFEQHWQKAVKAGRDVISLHHRAEEQFNILFTKIDNADDVIDFKMQEFIKKRINVEDKKAKQVGAATIIIGVMAFACIVVIGIFASRSICRPIANLRDSVVEIGKGNLEARADTSSNSEVGVLADAFNKTAYNLKKSIDNLNREIAEHKKTEQALLASEERFKQVAESFGDWIWEVNVEGLYTYSNPVVEEVLGYKPKEIVGKKYFYDCFASDVKEKLKKAAFEAFAKKESFKGFINPNMHKNGSTVILETTGTPIVDDKGNLCGYRGADRDITERKRSQEKLEKLNKDLELTIRELSRLNKELQEFAHITAHDLKTPLRGIGILADWLAKDYSDKLDELGKERVSLLAERAKRIDRIIDSMLQYSQVVRTEQKQQKIDLNVILSEVIREIAPPENITITIENELPTIQCEQTHIMQVFQNLLGNAVRYTDKPQGQIRVGCSEENGFWKLSVTDNGPGIEEKYFERIFRIFQMLSPHDKIEGIGIGLSLTKKIVELYGGKIWAESKVGEGSTFYFTLQKQEINIEDVKSEACTANLR